MLPRTCKLDINNNCDRKSIQEQIRLLVGDCRDFDHICLLGLEEQDVPRDYNQAQELGFGMSPLGKNRQDGSCNIKEFHERVLRSVIEIFYKERTKYISFLPGGFKECHEFVEKQNLIQLKHLCISN